MSELLDWLGGFHNCALTAYCEAAEESPGTWPESEAVRKRAFKLYEAELARKGERIQALER